MKILKGNKNEFFDFLDSIKPEDKIGILTHIDLDGVMSAILIEELLKTRNKKIDFLDFINYKVGMFKVPISKMKEKGITKLFVTDIYADGTDARGFEELRKEFDVFLIDHHPISEDFDYGKNIIKTQSADCCTIVIYDFVKDFINGDWKELICATLVSEVSYKNPYNLKFIHSVYPNVTLDNLRKSGPGKLSNEIGNTLIYLQSEKNGIKKVYDMIKNKNFEEIRKYAYFVEEEIVFWSEKFKKDAEFYSEKNIYCFYMTPKFNIASVVSTIISFENPDKSIILLSPIEKDFSYLKISARNQKGNKDMSLLLNNAIEGLENATAGGHRPASGGRIMKKDLDKFKENLLK